MILLACIWHHQKTGSLVLFQGHLEYRENSLLKEYQREINNFVSGSQGRLSSFTLNYFSSSKIGKIEELKQSLLSKPRHITLDESLISNIDLNWQSAGKIIYRQLAKLFGSGTDYFFFFCIFAQVSLRVTILLNESFSSSISSRIKYPLLSNWNLPPILALDKDCSN